MLNFWVKLLDHARNMSPNSKKDDRLCARCGMIQNQPLAKPYDKHVQLPVQFIGVVFIGYQLI